METHGQLLKKLIRRKKITQAQAAEQLNFSLAKLNRLFNQYELDEVIREEIEKIFQVPSSYFPTLPLAAPKTPTAPPGETNCWQQLLAAQQKIIELQQQIIEMSKPSVNAPVGKAKGQPV